MKQDNKYRYTIQFGMDSEKKVRVGEFLEQLGNRKAQLMVEALAEYLDRHPKLTAPNTTVVLELTKPDISKELVKKMVLEVLNNMDIQPPAISSGRPDAPASLEQYGVSDRDLDDMLNHIEAF